jgi:triosephosphate isomerase
VKTMSRKPLAISNWKMALTIAESLSFVHDFRAIADHLLKAVDVVVCPPYTALGSVAQVLRDSQLQLGAQNMAPTGDRARTGEVSARLLADAGCRWVILGHWEVRRHLGDDDDSVNHKVHLALEAGLRPILAVGEAQAADLPLERFLDRQLTQILAGCQARQVADMAFMYEPEGAIGVSAPTSPQHVAAACKLIRGWLRHRWGDAAAEDARIVYGGSVAPEYVADLLAYPEIDGLAATRRGREAATFAKIVQLIARTRHL